METKVTANSDLLGAIRVGKTPEQRLRWVIEAFVNKDISLARQEEKIALGKDLRLLIPAGWDGADKTQPIDAPTVDRLHRHISAGIKGLLDTRSQRWRIPRISGLSLVRGGVAGQYQLTGEGGEFEGVVLGIFNLILRLGSRIKKCSSDVCEKPFVAIRRQGYCSTACSQRERDKRRSA